MTEGQFDQHFMEIFAKGESAPSSRGDWALLTVAALLSVAVVGLLLVV